MGSGPSAISDSVDRKHKMRRRLGSGSFGIVSAVESVSTGKIIARKDVYFGKWAGIWYNKNLLAAVCDEINLMSTMRHENIIRIFYYEVFTDHRTISVYMECCDCSVLALVNTLVSKGDKLPGSTLIHISTSVLKALEYLHSRNIVHRDLKPDNVLVKRQGDGIVIKLCDFGVSMIHNNVNDYVFAQGTIPYMAPEVLKAHREQAPGRVTVASDLWSFGVTVELLCQFTASGSSKNAALALAMKCKAQKPADRPTAREARYTLSRNTRGTLEGVGYLISMLVPFLSLGWLFQVYMSCNGDISEMVHAVFSRMAFLWGGWNPA